MCYRNISLLCIVMCLSVKLIQTVNIDAIGFPEVEENPKNVNKQNRTPVFIPSMCPENELYYPGDQKSDWICDCRPGYLYHPTTDACWLAYQRGPCPKGQYLVLPNNTVIPVCVNNPCIGDNMVTWKGKCHTLGATAPCGVTYPAKVLWVNAVTVKLDCVTVNVENRFTSNIVEVATSLCPPGCKRSVNLRCIPDPRK